MLFCFRLIRGSIQDGEKRYKLEPINGREVGSIVLPVSKINSFREYSMQ